MNSLTFMQQYASEPVELSGWVLAALFLFAVGVGFWGGVLQHAHLSPSDGGVLGDYPRLLLQDGATVTVVNDAASTVVLTLTIPANTIAVGEGLRIYASGSFLQSTGIDQASPGIFMDFPDGQTVVGIVAGGFPVIVTSGSTRFWALECIVTNQGTSNASARGKLWVTNVASFTATPLILSYSNTLVPCNFGIDRNLVLRLDLPIASPSYSITKNTVLVERF